MAGLNCHIILKKSDRTIIYKTDNHLKYTPTPIPLTLTAQMSHPTIIDPTTLTPETTNVSTFIPENHQQLPFLDKTTPTLQSQSSITESVFIPSQIQHGFHPMTRGSPPNIYDPKDSTNSRYDKGPAYYVDDPQEYSHKYKIIPLTRPSFTSRPIQGKYPYPRHQYVNHQTQTKW